MPVESSRNISVFAYDDANAVDIFGPLQVFQTANELLDKLKIEHRSRYCTSLLSANQPTLRISTGTQVLTDLQFKQIDARELHTLVIAGGSGASAQLANKDVIGAISKFVQKSHRCASVCSGAFILAATGALDKRRATTHWKDAQEFQNQFPQVQLDIDALFTRDGKYACSAGVTAGIDMALQLVQEDHGRRVALETARQMVAFYHRPGGQNQFSSVTGCRQPISETLLRAQQWLHEHLSDAVDVSTLADIAHMSVRHFSRKFSAETGLSPARYIALARLNKARILLEESANSIARITALCGYGDTEIMRRLFLKELNVTPREYRKRFSVLHGGAP